MKFTTSVLALALAIGAIATPIVERDITPITDAVATIQSDVDSLNTVASSYSGGDTTQLQAASDKIVSDTNAGTTTVNGTPTIADLDALNLVGPIQALTTHINTAVDTVIGKKDALVAAGAGSQVSDDFNQQLAAATAFANALTSKVSSTLQSTAMSLSQGVLDAIQRGVDAFKDAGGSTTTTAAPTSTTGTTAPTTTAPTTTASGTGSAAPTTTASGTGSAAPTTTASGTGSAAPTSASGTGSAAPTYPASGTPTVSGVASGTGSATTSSASSATTSPFVNGGSVNAYSGAVGGLAAIAAILAL